MQPLIRVGLALFCTLICALSAHAQSAVTLKVLAKGTGVPVPRAEVKVGGAQLYTDKSGTVQITVPAAGDGAVEVYRPSYERLEIPFAELRGQSAYDAYLLPAPPADNEVIVRGTKRPETSRKNVSIQEAAKVAPGGDPAQVPKLLPGVQSSAFSPNIVVRGSGPNDSRYFIDEFSVPFIFHSIGNISIIPDQLLSDVEFSSGGFGAQYGGATGGVVTLRTKNEIPERPMTEFRINIPVLSTIYHERPLEDGKAFVAVSGRRSYLDAFLPFVLPKDSDLSVVPYFGDVHGYYFRQLDDGHVKMLLLSAYDGLKLVFPGDGVDESGRGAFNMRQGVNTVGVEWRKMINKDWSLTTSPQIGHTLNRIDVVGNKIHISGATVKVSSEASRRLSPKERLYVGAEVQLLQGEADVYAPRQDLNDPFFDFQDAPKVATKVKSQFVQTAAWAAVDQQLGDFLLTPGVRAFHTNQLKRAGVDPRLNARYQLTQSSALKAAAGQYSQTPEFRDTDENFGNPKLDYIRSYHYVFGIETDWDQLWTTDFQGFYKETRGVVRSDPETNTNNEGGLIAYGAEAFIRRNLTERLFGWLAYTYSVNRERDNEDETYRTSQYDQTHVVNLTGNYKLTGIWELGGRAIYHTGETYTTVRDAVYNANLDKYQQRTVAGQRLNDGRLPPYHEIDLFAKRDFLYDTWKLALHFGVELLALQRPAQGVQYNYDYSKEEFFRGVPPIPYVEVRGIL